MREAYMIMISCILVTLILILCVLIKDKSRTNLDYTLTEYVAKPMDTFWRIYADNYPTDKISYEEAFYNFKKDNNMVAYELIEGKVYLIRNYYE